MNKLIVSPSPHDDNYLKTSEIMFSVCMAMLPALAMGCCMFGANALIVTLVCGGS